ncbi:FERM, RhoGEF and pleckstrin domain-containing protein, putative [Pediculus humanus corporis]|uniref:Moesin/ezrin/radixin homolog 1 n=1 Tax=Pediculus humanus subsp. corporis TaxID=121224 RepID=E0VC18_PEDHC|nr:FERM, RhoGEF and pleckstrin domain-containing protein, putative [Pediculus humanus corporis]EEB10924.1 FERM, RhoGEF and pleckstrin domain-containing protein, putative [Pediculus humanus corporis]
MDSGKITHSQSQPGGIDRTPPGTPKKGGKMLAIRVQMLDDTVTLFQIQAKALARVLFDQVCSQLHLLESDYFGLEYQEMNGTKYWLDLEKPLSRQVGLSLVDTMVKFCVKFYTPDPSQLEEEFTRYLFCLQIKRDLSQGLLQCNGNTAALMASYIVQAECGDYVAEDYPDYRYLSTYKFMPNQDQELEKRIMENHKKHAGQSPAEADLNLLETARRCELYGIKMHPAKDHEGVPLNLAVAHMGIVVFQNFTKINTFSWAKIRKISFKRRRFLVKLHPEGYGYYKDTVEFFFEGRNECKNFWKKCVENHGFFRCSVVKKVPRHKTRVLSRGSSFSGRTQKQIVDFVRENYVKRQTFQSHDSYELLEKELDVFNNESGVEEKPKEDDSEICRARSYSWGSDKCLLEQGPLYSNIDPAYVRFRDNGFRSLEREKNTKYYNDGDFRSLDRNTFKKLSNRDNKESKIVSGALKHTIDGSENFDGTHLVTNKVICKNAKNGRSGITPKNKLNESESKKKRYNADKGYFMIKELLSTERTYKKNLEVINKWFHDEVSKSEDDMPDDVLNGLFNLFDPLNIAHSQFLKDLEHRMATWEGKSNNIPKREIQQIGELILNHFNILPLYVKYLDKHLLILERLDAAFRKNKKFEILYRDFELQRVCYLPLSSFIMKPLQKLIHYNSLLQRMIMHYGPDYSDYKDFSIAQKKLQPVLENISTVLRVSENFVQLSELQRDMPSFEGLLQGGREFIRQGCLLKHSKKGFQQRMFFLFSDILVYSNRCTTPSLQFKVNGQMPLRGVMIEQSDDKMGTNFTFTIYGGNRTLIVAASSQEEKERWLEDLYEAVQNAREKNDGKTLKYLSLKSCSSSDEVIDKVDDEGNLNRNNKNSQQRSNTTVHVCWHRNTSTSIGDHLKSYENELSGFLLRKFKNSNGWQKLWDESPLASLPLLGYSITIPEEEDEIKKDYVFKLQFKNHVYFFRAESDYTFSRWMEVIRSSTKNTFNNVNNY